MSNGKNSGINILGILGMIVASPILLLLFIVGGVLALGKMLLVITNPLLIAVILLVEAALYRSDKLTFKNVLLTGLIFGFLFWIVGLALFFASLGICGTPIIGAIVCGGISLVSIFTDAFGYILGGILLSSVIGGVLMMFRRN